ncbi:DUF4241 domain-containing protein [Catellatospora aurea]|uniref:DUF4241 domain-containing protein n=1 Tax=Catellatospora aurea TaxID=1337874 RepID=A0ABW2H879_9ACTN
MFLHHIRSLREQGLSTYLSVGVPITAPIRGRFRHINPSASVWSGGSLPRVIDIAVLGRAFAGDGCSQEQVGTLRVRSGAVVAADPVHARRPAFTVEIPNGDHPVVGVDDMAAVILIVADGHPTRWELALLPGQDVSELAANATYGYPVDSGFGSFVDAEGALLWAEECEALDEPAFLDAMDDLLFDENAPDGHLIGSLLPDDGAVRVHNPLGYNLVTFVSGRGDGYYATWVGLDSDNLPICLLTDFGLLLKGIAEPPAR